MFKLEEIEKNTEEIYFDDKKTVLGMELKVCSN